MADTRTLTTAGQDTEAVSVLLRGLSVKSGLPISDAIEDASAHLGEALGVLKEIAANSSEPGPYAVLTSVAIAKALVDSVATAVELAHREVARG